MNLTGILAYGDTEDAPVASGSLPSGLARPLDITPGGAQGHQVRRMRGWERLGQGEEQQLFITSGR